MNELSDFLRSRRARLTPADVGLADWGRRRVPGLRREEVAQLAGVSTDYYIRLEQGRGHQVSDSVLDAVSRALRLDAAEHAYLKDLARPKGRKGERRAAVRESVRRIVDGFTDSPALLVNGRMVVLAANRLGAAVFGITDDPATHDRARQFFLDPRSKEFFADWTGDATTVTGALRRRAGQRPDDPELTALIGELSIKSAEFRSLWARHNVKDKESGTKRLRHPVVGELVLTYERLDVAGDDDHYLTVYQAEPGSATAERLAVLASWTA